MSHKNIHTPCSHALKYTHSSLSNQTTCSIGVHSKRTQLFSLTIFLQIEELIINLNCRHSLSLFLSFLLPCRPLHHTHAHTSVYICIMYRYAIGNAERPILKSKIGWLDILANDTHEYYYPNNTGGPSIKVSFNSNKSHAPSNNW